MKHGLSQNAWTRICEVFRSHPQIHEVILYGSRAMGNFKPGSDIDLTLKGDSIDLRLLNKINLQLDDLLLPQTFDLSVFENLKNPDLLDHIARVGVKVYTI